MRLRPVPVLLLLAALALVAFYGWNGRTAANGRTVAGAAVGGTGTGSSANAAGVAAAGTSSIRAIDPSAPGGLPGQLHASTAPVASDSQPRRTVRIAELQASTALALSIRDAANADDVAANSFAMEMIDFCLRNASAAAKVQANSGAWIPVRLRASTGKEPPDPLREASERTRMQESNRVLVQACKDFSLDSAKADANTALQRLIARGSLYPELMNLVTQPLDLGALTPEQYDLIGRALRDRDAGTLALLGQVVQPLLANLTANISAQGMTDPRYYADAVTPIAWQLALCQLGAHCGQDSLWAREACLKFGACTGDDLGAAVRAALTRDGLNPALLDKQVEQYLRAINGGDPAALGLRRRKP